MQFVPQGYVGGVKEDVGHFDVVVKLWRRRSHKGPAFHQAIHHFRVDREEDGFATVPARESAQVGARTPSGVEFAEQRAQHRRRRRRGQHRRFKHAAPVEFRQPSAYRLRECRHVKDVVEAAYFEFAHLAVIARGDKATGLAAALAAPVGKRGLAIKSHGDLIGVFEFACGK